MWNNRQCTSNDKMPISLFRKATLDVFNRQFIALSHFGTVLERVLQNRPDVCFIEVHFAFVHLEG